MLLPTVPPLPAEPSSVPPVSVVPTCLGLILRWRVEQLPQPINARQPTITTAFQHRFVFMILLFVKFRLLAKRPTANVYIPGTCSRDRTEGFVMNPSGGASASSERFQ
jgi:hypothetical protein